MNQANAAELHTYVNNLNGHTHIPLGYTHTLVGKTFIKTLIDSGNLFGTICSEKLAKQLNLSVSPCSLKAGTAVAGQPVEVLGKVKPFFIVTRNSGRFAPFFLVN